MKLFIFGLIGFVFLMGCCGPTTSVTSSSCPYGTYGDTCSTLCSKTGNTAFSDYPDSYCYENCLSFVKQYNNNAHFSTCCKESAGQACENTCNKQLNDFKGMFGEYMDETDEEFLEPCIGECTYFYSMYGINPNKICNIMDMNMIEESIYYGIYD